MEARKTSTDKQVIKLTDGNERIQCIEVNTTNSPLLIVSVYLPAKGKQTSVQEFQDTVDILAEILKKYESTHEIVIGGDLNEDLLADACSSKRLTYLNEVITEFNLHFSSANKTYVNPQGEECSEIDYFLTKTSDNVKISKKSVLNDIDSNTSDHHPIQITITLHLDSREHVPPKETQQKGRIRWNKIDLGDYATAVERNIDLDQFKDQDTPISEKTEKLIQILEQSSKDFVTKPKPRRNKPKLQVWNQEIAHKLKALRTAVKKWSTNGKPKSSNSQLNQERKKCKKEFRGSIRRENAVRSALEKEKIINTRKRDPKLFHKLVKQQRKLPNQFIEDLHVGEMCFKDTDILYGFKIHFEELAKPSENTNYDNSVNNIVKQEVSHIMNVTRNNYVDNVAESELDLALSLINRGKAPDIYNLTIESVLYSGDKFKKALLMVINEIFQHGYIPDNLKLGLLHPIFKNKGKSNDSVNYRGITILPVLEKIVEAILKNRIVQTLESTQSPYQRGFTKHTSPLHAAVIVEEIARDNVDNSKPCNFIFLDAKAAFDVVNHDHLIRRLFHSGVQDRHLHLISSLHNNSSSSVKWLDQLSEPFTVFQGVRQGGVASTDFYKTYINPLLQRYQNVPIGSYIGNIHCNAIACADDVAICSNDFAETQQLVSIAEDFANQERYTLQPTKSETIQFKPNQRKSTKEDQFELYNGQIPNVKQSTHLGIIRATTLKETREANIERNIAKARRTAYSLMASGLHGENGLDPETSLHLINSYVTPILLYGLEILLPTLTELQQLEIFQKKLLKQVLSLPTNTNDEAVYMLSGFLPVEAQIHKRALTLYNNICHQPPCSVEKQLAERQLQVKSSNSASWFIAIKKLNMKYDLVQPEDMLLHPIKPSIWKSQVNKSISSYWEDKILHSAKLSCKLKLMNKVYTTGSLHPVLSVPVKSMTAVRRLPVKLRLLTGTYQLQSTKAAFNQNQVNPTCMLCEESPETIEHFILDCVMLKPIRNQCINELTEEIKSTFDIDITNFTSAEMLKIVLDCSHLLQNPTQKSNYVKLGSIEFMCRRLVNNLHVSRLNLLSAIGRSKQRRGNSGKVT